MICHEPGSVLNGISSTLRDDVEPHLFASRSSPSLGRVAQHGCDKVLDWEIDALVDDLRPFCSHQHSAVDSCFRPLSRATLLHEGLAARQASKRTFCVLRLASHPLSHCGVAVQLHISLLGAC